MLGVLPRILLLTTDIVAIFLDYSNNKSLIINSNNKQKQKQV